MSQTREVVGVFAARPTVEGAGVHLRRAFGFGQEHRFDPFLMLDDFRSHDPAQYLPGFPWHPHRGIETITYVIEGEVEHGDSMGNTGVIGPGDVQWMTAGSGIIHQEMPAGDERGRMGGFQLWANLPAGSKMSDPRYCGVDSDEIPEVETDDAKVRVICGAVGDVEGPVRDIVIEPEYLDTTVKPGRTWTHPTPRGHTVFAYLFEGAGCFGGSEDETCALDGTLVLFGAGDEVRVKAGDQGARFLLVGGLALHEPIAWGGPIVMSTEEELRTAFQEYRDGTFVKHGAGGR